MTKKRTTYTPDQRAAIANDIASLCIRLIDEALDLRDGEPDDERLKSLHGQAQRRERERQKRQQSRVRTNPDSAKIVDTTEKAGDARTSQPRHQSLGAINAS